jgi:hypothetical protein
VFIHIAYWFPIILVSVIAGLYFYTRPTRIDLSSDSLIIHSAYKDYIYPRGKLTYEGDVNKSAWCAGLYRKFGNGWPLPLAGKFQNGAYGDFVIASMKRTDVLQRVVVDGKTLLLQLSDEQIKELSRASGRI